MSNSLFPAHLPASHTNLRTLRLFQNTVKESEKIASHTGNMRQSTPWKHSFVKMHMLHQYVQQFTLVQTPAHHWTFTNSSYFWGWLIVLHTLTKCLQLHNFLWSKCIIHRHKNLSEKAGLVEDSPVVPTEITKQTPLAYFTWLMKSLQLLAEANNVGRVNPNWFYSWKWKLTTRKDDCEASESASVVWSLALQWPMKWTF